MKLMTLFLTVAAAGVSLLFKQTIRVFTPGPASDTRRSHRPSEPTVTSSKTTAHSAEFAPWIEPRSFVTRCDN